MQIDPADMDRFREGFFDEAAEHLAAMESGLLRLENTPQDQELLHTIFRGAHSIKGTSATFGFADLARFTHGLEGVLDQVRAGAITLAPALMELLFRATDMLKALVVSARQGIPGPATADTILKELEHVIVPRERVYRVGFTPGPDLLRQGLDPLLLLRNVLSLGEVLVSHKFSGVYEGGRAQSGARAPRGQSYGARSSPVSEREG